MRAFGDDFAVPLDRNLLAGKREPLDQRGDDHAFVEPLGRPVDRHLYHAANDTAPEGSRFSAHVA